MITHFDIFLWLGILLAMFLSKRPKQGAVAIVAIIASAGVLIDYWFPKDLVESLGLWIEYFLASSLEATGAILLTFWATMLKKRADAQYFYLMAAFLLASSSVVVLFRNDVIVTQADYIFYAQLVAVLHLLTMLIFSDGIRNLARSTYDILSSNRSGLSNLRG